MATIDMDLYDALKAANVPDEKARAAAAALRRTVDETRQDLVSSNDLGAAVDRLENQSKALELRFEIRIESAKHELSGEIQSLTAEVKAVDAKIDAVERRLDAKLTMLQWVVGLNIAICLGILWKLLR